MAIRFDEQVVIVTGAGNGLGKSHALEFARRGAHVVVNDLGGSRDGSGGSSEAAEAVVTEIENAGGEALANGANVADFSQVEAMVTAAREKWGRVDVLVNNAGILRDKTFAKMELDDFPTRTQCASARFGKLHQSCMGDDARAAIRSYRNDLIVQWYLRQLRPDELRRRQNGSCGIHEFAGTGGEQVQHQSQFTCADCGNAYD